MKDIMLRLKYLDKEAKKVPILEKRVLALESHAGKNGDLE